MKFHNSEGVMSKELHIYQISDTDWVLAESEDQAKEVWSHEVGEDWLDESEIRMIPDDKLDCLDYYDDNGCRTFREELERLKGMDAYHPHFFASTEW